MTTMIAKEPGIPPSQYARHLDPIYDRAVEKLWRESRKRRRRDLSLAAILSMVIGAALTYLAYFA